MLNQQRRFLHYIKYKSAGFSVNLFNSDQSFTSEITNIVTAEIELVNSSQLIECNLFGHDTLFVSVELANSNQLIESSVIHKALDASLVLTNYSQTLSSTVSHGALDMYVNLINSSQSVSSQLAHSGSASAELYNSSQIISSSVGHNAISASASIINISQLMSSELDNLVKLQSSVINAAQTLSVNTGHVRIISTSLVNSVQTVSSEIENNANAFKFTIDTQYLPDTTFVLPLRDGYSYNFVVYWGDGNSSTITSYADAEKLHTYASNGVYQISILGTCTAWYHSDDAYVTAVTSINQWGQTGFTNLEYAFSCSVLNSHLTGTLSVPDYYNGVDQHMYSGCLGPCTAVLHSNISYIEFSAFGSGTYGLTGGITLPTSLTSIGGLAFNRCSGLTGTLVFPSNLLTIGQFAFRGCTGFTGGITIPNSVTTIGDSTFAECSNLTGTFTIGTGVTVIYDKVLQYTNISRIDSYRNPAPNVASVKSLYTYNSAVPLHVKVGATGYDSLKWTTSPAFSSIIYDL